MERHPYGYWKTMTFIAALRHDRVEAPWVLNEPINGQAFQACVETQFVKTLKPDDIVVLDSLGSHKGAMVRDVVRAAGARLWYLPPYSPDLNLCMDGSCGSRCRIGFGEQVGCGHVYGV